MLKWQWLLWPVTLGLTACINLGPSQGAPVQEYQLVNGAAHLPILQPKACTISVQQGWVAKAYSSTAMAYQIHPYQASYFALNRWQTPPLTMITGNLAQALQNSGGFKAVVIAPPYVGLVDRVVHVNLLQLNQVFDATGSSAKERLQVQLLTTQEVTQKLMSQKTFTVEVPVAATPFGGVAGASQAWQKMLPDMIAYIYHECA